MKPIPQPAREREEEEQKDREEDENLEARLMALRMPMWGESFFT